MMKQEFTALIGVNLPDHDWDIVQTVYQFHPAISDTDGKRQIADLYLSFGMLPIIDMLERAQKIGLLKQKISVLEQEIEHHRNEITALSNF